MGYLMYGYSSTDNETLLGPCLIQSLDLPTLLTRLLDNTNKTSNTETFTGVQYAGLVQESAS